MNCYVYGCKSNWNPFDDISFFKFPLKDEALLKKWFEVIPFNKNRKITKNSRICSNHFEESQYKYSGNKRMLKEGATPIFPYVDDPETNVEDENWTPAHDTLKVRDKSNKYQHQCDIQEQEISSSHILLPSKTTERTQAIFQIDKATQVIPETRDAATQMSPEQWPSEIEEKLHEQINVLEKRLSHKEIKLLKVNQQLKYLRAEGQEKG